MPARLRGRRPSPAFVISLIALFVALGGVSYGVATGSIDGREVRNNSLTSSDIKNSSLLRKDFRAGQLQRGATGPAGARGLQGVQGPAGVSGFGQLRYPGDGADVPLTDTDQGFLAVPCPAGTYPTGGDAFAQTDPANPDDSVPIEGVTDAQFFDIGQDGRPNGWLGVFTNDSGVDITVFVDAICANGTPPAVLTSAEVKRVRTLKARARGR